MKMPPFTKPTYCYRVLEVTRIIDADTIDVMLDVGFHTYLHKRLRFLGIDTWEVRGEEKEKGILARDRLKDLLAAADTIYVQTEMDSEGKYGRVLAWVWAEREGAITNINEVLLLENHGAPY